VIALENRDYTLVQVVRNFGAAAIVDGLVLALYQSGASCGRPSASWRGWLGAAGSSSNEG
jgi:hypothetical protein